jgi:hypothetical protein
VLHPDASRKVIYLDVVPRVKAVEAKITRLLEAIRFDEE